MRGSARGFARIIGPDSLEKQKKKGQGNVRVEKERTSSEGSKTEFSPPLPILLAAALLAARNRNVGGIVTLPTFRSARASRCERSAHSDMCERAARPPVRMYLERGDPDCRN